MYPYVFPAGADKQMTIEKPVPFAKSNASVLLDLVRGLAALIVLLEHWRNIFFVDYPQIAVHRIWFAPFYILCSAGHQAVVIFFVLSGYLISRSVFRMLERGTWDWRLYLTHRLLRLWIVLIPGLLLCAVWDGIGLHLGVAPVMYHGMSVNHMVRNVTANYTLHTFVANIAFLQDIRATTFGSDGPLWSLANEFWYYVLFPLGLFAVRPKTRMWVRAVCVAGFVAVAWLVGLEVLGRFPIWLLGTALALVPVPRLKQAVRVIAGVAYVPVFFVIGRRLPLPLMLVDYILGAATFGLLWVMLSARTECRPSVSEWFSRGLARFSYTLYVAHMPLCVLLAALIVGDSRWWPTGAHLAGGVGVFGVLVGYAYALAWATEFKTARVRGWIEGRFFGGKA